jgi:4-diphosphocytidyl-2-C-methyl-D-erythritol kinase
MPGAAVTVRAPAKLNLHLSVGALREDGFHELTTVYQAVSLFDDVIVEPAAHISVETSGEAAGQVPSGNDNLAVRAARALARWAGVRAGARLHVHKGIPVAGGMAGGSADAAAALVGCAALWGLRVSRAELLALAAEVGSDVPFSVTGGTALGTGRGEALSPVLSRGDYHWVLAVQDAGLSTPIVYAELDRLRAAGAVDQSDRPQPPERVLAALSSGDAVQLGGALTNDLEPVALRLRPQLRRTLSAGRELGALGAMVSGSGPTCAFLAKDAAAAVRLAAALAGAGVCRWVRTASGPATGARLLDDEVAASP